jgi:hypothetical protein
MRCIAVTLALFALSITSPRAQVRGLDKLLVSFRAPDPLPECDLERVVRDLARSARILIGFENSIECALRSIDRDSPALAATVFDMAGYTTRQILDRFVLPPYNYRWNEMNGVVVIRPQQADGTILNRPAAPFKINDTLAPALNAVHRAVIPNWKDRGKNYEVTPPSPLILRPIELDFRGGTLLDALNAVVAAHGTASWQVSYRLVPNNTVTSVSIGLYTPVGGLGFGTPVSEFGDAR